MITSRCCKSQFCLVARAITVRIVVQRTTGAKVSRKSMPSVCSFPLATMRALSFLTYLEGLLLVLKIHMALIGVFPGGMWSTNCQV